MSTCQRIVSLVLCVTIVFSICPTCAIAEGIAEGDDFVQEGIPDAENNLELIIVPAVTSGSARTVSDIITQYKFTWPQGHGFAAEQGNNLVDQMRGTNAVVVGDNNVRNGADRLILNRDGTKIFIQDKYYSSAKASIDACFDSSGAFRYLDADGNVMRIEVPKDQYEAAIHEMEVRIRNGEIPGVSDPSEAKSIVREGSLTYEQARNLARAGTIESLTYDAVHGVISASCAFGISTVLNYAVCRLNGEDRIESIKVSAIEGVKSGTGAFCTAVIAGQLSKTGILNVFKPSSEALMKALGEDFSETLLKAFGQRVAAEGSESAAEAATKQAARLLRSEVLVAVVTTIVFSVPDSIDMFRGRISKKQFVKNFTVTAASVVAGTVGYGVGGAVGNLVAPGAGTAIGGIAGSMIIGTGGAILADKIADYIVDDDAVEMYDIVVTSFTRNCEEYMVNEAEAEEIVAGFSGLLTEEMFKNMYQSKDREAFISEQMEPFFEQVVSEREKMEAPTEEEMRAALKEELTGVVFIH